MGLSPGNRLGPYKIEAQVGAGGMGEVYRAKDLRLDRVVAIKVLPQHVVDHPTRRQRFEREARAASRLSHPHICALYDIGEQDGVLYLVMEYLAGESLADRLKTGALPIKDALQHAIEIADALDHAHRHGIVHRDLKPANIMLTRSGAKLLDFGVARFERSELTHTLAARPTESLTAEGTILGTVQYMAPEQLEGKETDARTDIFAFGAVAYEMATGRQAFESENTASLIAAILQREPPSLTSVRRDADAAATNTGELVPQLLEHVIARCLAKTPDDRWQTAADVRQELRWIAQGSGRLQAARPRTPARRWVRRVALTAVGVMLAIAAGYGAFRLGWVGRASPTGPTFTQLTFRRGNTTQARFASDGQTILYSAAWDGGPVQIFESRPHEPASRAIGPPGAGLASVSSTNELALLLGCELDNADCTGTLARMPLSGGAPREVLENVFDADWSPDGRLAVIHLAEGESRVEFPIGKTLSKSAGMLRGIAFSPLGDRLAFIDHPILAEEVGDLKVIDLPGGSVKTLVAGWKTIRAVRWSPDGDAVWFSGSQKGKTSNVYAVSLSSGNVRLILQVAGDITLRDVSRDGRGRMLLSHGMGRARMILASGNDQREMSWLDWSTVGDISSDGKTLLFHEWGIGVDGNPVVYMRETTGGDATRLGDGKALALSPDGRWALALLETPASQLVLLSTGTGEPRVLPMRGLTDVYWAKWFPDGRRLLVVSSGADLLPRSYVQDTETGDLKQLADLGSLGCLVSPDGQSVLVRDPLGNFDVWPVAGGDPVRLDGILPDDRPIAWSRDGTIYLHSEDQRALRVYRYSVSTRRREPWKQLSPKDAAGVVDIASGRVGVVITPDGRSIAYTYWVLFEDLFLVEGAGR